MIRTVGPWSVTREQVVYDNPWIRVVDHAVVHPSGQPGQYGVVRFKNIAIGILAIDADGMIPLVGQHRFPLDAYSWELPEGGGPIAVDPLVSAKRELEEETGTIAAEWLLLADLDLSNSVTDERAVCFLAWNLSAGLAAPEPSEALALRRVTFGDLHEQVLSGNIRDSLTIIMVLKAAALARQGRLPEPLPQIMGVAPTTSDGETGGRR